MKPVIDHMKATGYADKCVDEAMGVCKCDVCNLARAYLDLRNHNWKPDTYPALVQALSNLAGVVPSVLNAEVWIEYRRTARALLAELGKGEVCGATASGPGVDLDIPTFLRKGSKPRVTQAFEAEQREKLDADARTVFINDVRKALMLYEGTLQLHR